MRKEDGIQSEPWTVGVTTPLRLLCECSENKLVFCAGATGGKRRLPRRLMRTKCQKGDHLSLTLRHLGHNRPLSVFLIYLIRWPVDIALSSFLCVCKLVGFNRFFFFFSLSQDTDKHTQRRQARNASTADSGSDCCSRNWWPQLFVQGRAGF